MNIAAGDRLQLERRLLAALLLWPRAVDLDAHHFVAPEHGLIYEAIDEAQDVFPYPAVNPEALVYDDVAVAVVIGIACTSLRGRRAAMPAAIRSTRASVSWSTDWERLERFVTDYILHQQIGPNAIDELVAAVRACHRCGH